jgi:uncharacterized SAM-binding protein YcdF (DUF218 family)
VIYVHKVLPLFFLPTFVTLLLMVLGLLLRRRFLCWAGIAIMCLSSMPLVSDLLMRTTEGWQVRKAASSAPSAQAIVVLSTGRTQPPGDPEVSEWTDADRFYGGVELFKAGKAPLLLFTGGWVPWRPAARPEGEILIQYAADLGVPRNRMLTTGKVSNTEQESRAVAELLRKSASGAAAPRILLVTSAFHMRRAQRLFQRAGVEVEPFPVDFKVQAWRGLSWMHFVPNAGSLVRAEESIRELYGVAFYSIFEP